MSTLKDCNPVVMVNCSNSLKIQNSNFDRFTNLDVWESDKFLNAKHNIMTSPEACNEYKKSYDTLTECELEHRIHSKLRNIADIIITYNAFTVINRSYIDGYWNLIRKTKQLALTDFKVLVVDLIGDVDLRDVNLFQYFEPLIYDIYNAIIGIDDWMRNIVDVCKDRQLIAKDAYPDGIGTYKPRLFLFEALYHISQQAYNATYVLSKNLHNDSNTEDV